MTTMLDWSAQLPEQAYPTGSVLLREGERRGRLFILVDGAVEIVRGNTVVSVTDEPGSILGEMSILLDGPPTATVRTVRPSRLRHSDDPHGFLTAHPTVTYALAVSLARRLDTITGYLADLRAQYADRADNLGMVDVVLSSLSQHPGRAVDPGSEREPESPY